MNSNRLNLRFFFVVFKRRKGRLPYSLRLAYIHDHTSSRGKLAVAIVRSDISASHIQNFLENVRFPTISLPFCSCTYPFLYNMKMKLLTFATVVSYVSAMSQTAAEYNRKYYGGAGVGRLNLDKGVKLEQWECKYDILLVERIQGKPKTETGLFVPEEELPRFHIARVLSMGSG